MKYLPALSRYGVPSPVAAIVRAVGVSSRTLAIKLERAYPFDKRRPTVVKVTDWLSNLRLEDLTTILGDERRARRVFIELQEAQLGNPGVEKFHENGWDDIEVRGLRFYTDSENIKALQIGVRVLLFREPENPYDPNAIQVLIPAIEQMIGYVDRDYARIIAPALDSGISFKASVSKLTSPTKYFPLGRLFIQILEEA